MKKIKKLVKRGTAMLLAVVLLALAGCGGNNADSNNDLANQDGQQEGNSTKAEENSAKGRYMESDLSFPEGLIGIIAIEKLEDGSITLLDIEKGAFISKDGGETWEKRDTFLLDSIGTDDYIYHAAIGKDGSYFAMYFEDDEAESDEAGEIITEGDNATAVFATSFSKFKYIYIDKDGNATQINPNMEDDSIGDSVSILSDGRLLISLYNEVYTVDKSSGEVVKLCETDEDHISYMQQVGNVLYLVGSTIKQYDLETNSFIEDPVLDEFSKEKLKAYSAYDSYDSGGTKTILICEGDEENSVYIACSDGLYRHVVGGNVMEEIIKGSLTSLGDPSLSYLTMIRKDDGEFLIGYFNYSTKEVSLKKYVYDSEADAVPENMLKIYSLTEDDSIRQAVAEYQKNHSDVYIKYEVGLSDENSMTKEDAIRNLNTELLSGEGPDIILLDGMPVKSYMEKGILADLSELLSNNFEQDAFFENIINTYKKDDKIYAVPTRFQIPVIYSEKSIIDKITDLTTLADTVEKLHEEQETGTVTGIYTESEALSRLYEVNSPAWIAEDGTVKKEELAAFLTEVKRIYQAEQKNISETERKEHEESVASGLTYMGEGFFLDASNDAFAYLSDKQQIGFGKTKCVSTAYMDYAMIISVLKRKETEQKIKLMPGQKGNVFMPGSVIGICESSPVKELAMSFVADMLSEDTQTMSIETGFPVNKKAFSSSLASPYESEEAEKEQGISMMWTSEGDEGTGTDYLEIKWISEEEKKQLEEIVASLDTPSISDDTIKDVVLELAPAALNGEKSVDDVVNEIINKVQIYLSE